MKKKVLFIVFLGIVSFCYPQFPGQPDCATTTITCPDGITHTILICDMEDVVSWAEILCGLGTD